MVLAKICGLSTRPALAAALEGGAAFVGFMLVEASPRRVNIADAAELASVARGRAKIVAVTVDPDDDLVRRLAAELAPDFIQLHGQESPARARAVADLAGASIIKALPVSNAADLDRAHAYDEAAAHLMFDAKAPPGASRPGGHGQAFDWSLLAGQKFRRPWFLAGGLGPDNIAGAIAASGAPMVDVSSGVEDVGGLKDAALITRFLDAVRRA